MPKTIYLLSSTVHMLMSYGISLPLHRLGLTMCVKQNITMFNYVC